MLSLQLYDKLLELPLFQGLSKENLAVIVSQTKLGFIKLRSGQEIVRAGEPCEALYILMSGMMEVETKSDDYGYTFLEELTAPQTIQIESIFGLKPRYTRTYRAKGVCNFLSLEKNELIKLLDAYLIFRINFLNAVSTYAQRLSRLPWKYHPNTIQGRLIHFFSTHCLSPVGKKVLVVKMIKLAEELNDTRLEVSKGLNELEEQGLVRLYRGKVEIPALEKLFY